MAALVVGQAQTFFLAHVNMLLGPCTPPHVVGLLGFWAFGLLGFLLGFLVFLFSLVVFFLVADGSYLFRQNCTSWHYGRWNPHI